MPIELDSAYGSREDFVSGYHGGGYIYGYGLGRYGYGYSYGYGYGHVSGEDAPDDKLTLLELLAYAD